MNPDLALCPHFAGLAAGSPLPEIAHAFLFQDGPIDAIARCRSCGAHALLRLLDWAPARFSLRVYSLASLRAEDSALFLRNVERGSCQVSRASAELDALIAAAGPSTRLVALDLARERVAASAALPTSASGEPGAWPARLPRESDARWFTALGLEKRADVEAHALATEISATNLTSERDATEFLSLVDAYARDPMGGGAPLREDVRARLVPDLRERIARGVAVVLIARRVYEHVGFVDYSPDGSRTRTLFLEQKL